MIRRAAPDILLTAKNSWVDTGRGLCIDRNPRCLPPSHTRIGHRHLPVTKTLELFDASVSSNSSEGL
jgi:hypothetical protein